MPTLNRNSQSRLRRVQANLQRIQDQLHQAHGAVFPEELASYRAVLADLIKRVDTLLEKIAADLVKPGKIAAADLQGGTQGTSYADDDEVDS